MNHAVFSVNRVAGAALCWTLAAAPALALQVSPPDAATRYACGGIGQSEQLQMKALRPAYSLWVSTVSQVGGAFLADARLRVSAEGDAAPRVDLRMDGPWCLLALPEGRYRIEVTLNGQSAPPQTLAVPADGLVEALFRLPAAVDLSPERAASGAAAASPAPRR